jgi:FHA domain
MSATIVGLTGNQAGRRFTIGEGSITFGRGDDNDIVLTDSSASRNHAEVRKEAGGYFLYDRGSSNGTWVNGAAVSARQLQSGDQITIGDELFRFETSLDVRPTIQGTIPSRHGARPHQAAKTPASVLRVTITGGGPVGLSFALLLEHMMGSRVQIKIYDGRWTQGPAGKLVWKSEGEGNARRLQVVTIQSRQFLRLPPEVQEQLFIPGHYTEMWPSGPDSIQDLGPRNVRIAFIEDQLLALAGEKTDRIQLIPQKFEAAQAHDEIASQHVLAICEGGKSRTYEHFIGKFGAADATLYGIDGEQVSDMVLGLRVKSELPDPMSVLLTVTQNRFLLNSLRGEGFLNMRLTDTEAKEAVGIDPVRQVFTECIQSGPCLLELRSNGEFFCEAHRALFLPALLKGSAFWTRVEEGLQMFGVRPENLTAVTGFRLDMVQRPRFSVQLFPRTRTTPGTFGFLLGDAANAIHFWPGRGLNSGLASAISLARCLAAPRRGATMRDADFVRHEAVMSMLQYRHKNRAWRQMVTHDLDGNLLTIKGMIARGIEEGEQGAFNAEQDFEALMQRMTQTRSRLEYRIGPMPDDATLRAHLQKLPAPMLHALLVSEPWDSANVGGEEVDVEWLLDAPRLPRPERSPVARPVTTAP